MAEAEKVTIRCRVFSGMFSTERHVEFQILDGRTVCIPITKQRVRTSQEPSEDVSVEGTVDVVLLEKNDDYVLIEVPEPPTTHGSRLKVPMDLIEFAPA